MNTLVRTYFYVPYVIINGHCVVEDRASIGQWLELGLVQIHAVDGVPVGKYQVRSGNWH